MSLSLLKAVPVLPLDTTQIHLPLRGRLNLPNINHRVVWAIGGGKGGIGKSLIATNLAVFLSWLQKRVIAVDMDLGGANLHTLLGVEPSKHSLSSLLTGHSKDPNELLQATAIPNLFLLNGASNPLDIANLRHVQKARLIRKFKELSADFLLLDLGAGTSTNTIDFFLLADQKIIVVTPEPTSIENAYRFMKAAFFRMLGMVAGSTAVRQLIELALHPQNDRPVRTPAELLQEIDRISPTDGAALAAAIKKFNFSVIVNQVRTAAEADVGGAVKLVCEKYFGIQVRNVGYLPHDTAVWQSIRRRKPFLVDAPNSVAVTHLELILRNLLNFHLETAAST